MSLRCLIAEDDEDIAYQYQTTLEAFGHEVEVVRNGEELTKKYLLVLEKNYKNRLTPYDVVVIDYLMPIKDGIYAAKEILKECTQQRIILVTGHGPKLLPELNDFGNKVEAFAKPMPLTAFIAKIEKRPHKAIVEQLHLNLKK